MLQSTSVSWQGALHTSDALAFMSGSPGFVVATQGTPLNLLVLVAGGALFPESQGIMTIRGMVVASYHSRALHTQWIEEHPLVFF